MRMERGERRHTASVYGNISKKFFFANSEAQEGSSPGAPALHSVPVGPSIVRPAWTLGPCLCHMVWGTLLTSGRTSVAMSFLCISICDPVDPESLFQSIISFNKVVEPIKDSLFNILPWYPRQLEYLGLICSPF